jgi:hypothetical protein
LRHVQHDRGTALSVVALAIVVLSVVLVVGLVAANSGGARQRCTHGVSSVGPVFIKDGKIVGGDTTPDTQACLP